jgi:hypothetical protein
MNEHLFTLCLIRYRYNPVATTTILSHDRVDDTYMGVTLWVDNATILTSSHRGEDIVKAIHCISLVCVCVCVCVKHS